MIRVTVVYSPAPRQTHEWVVSLGQERATVLMALAASGLPQSFPGLDLASAQLGVWGVRAALKTGVKDGDRVEIYRSLVVDPKVARRERFRRQGKRAAGLFTRKK